MQGQQLKYAGNYFIKQDLRRLKSISSLEQDILEAFSVVRGLIDETSWPPPFDFCGGLITKLSIDDEVFLCFKDRVPTVRPKLNPSSGCRLIYALGIDSQAYVPLLLYRANEEGETYSINNKKFNLTSSNLGKIINEKLK